MLVYEEKAKKFFNSFEIEHKSVHVFIFYVKDMAMKE